MSLPKPQYTIWQAISAALALAMRATEEVRALSREPGPKGDPGPQGEPGFQIDEFFVDVENDRTFVFKFRRGEKVAEWGRATLPVQIYRGVFKFGQSYERGDTITWDNSTWHCNQPTNDKPGNGNKSWQLCARKGADGKDGKDGALPPRSTTPFGDK